MPDDRQSRARSAANLQRVPPHDLEAEESLLGAALLPGPGCGGSASSGAAQVCAAVDPAAWYKPAHAALAEAIGRLVERGMPIDAVLVAAELRDVGQLEAAGGRAQLLALQAACPSIGNAGRYAAVVVEMARRRRIVGIGAEVVEAVYEGAAQVGGLAAELQLAVEEADLDQESDWEPVNLARVLAGEGTEMVPGFLCRDDGRRLLYPGGLHAFNGPSESAKSWLALWACMDRMAAGEHSLYIDFEDSAVSVVTRLLAMGAPPGQIMERFHYIRPDSGLHVVSRLRLARVLRAWPIAVAVVDSFGEAMGTSGYDENKAADIYTFLKLLPRVLQRAGAAVILVDHVVKDAERQDGSGRGSTAKSAGVDAALLFRPVSKPGRDKEGLIQVLVAKNRHGHLRGDAAGPGAHGLAHWADMVLTSSEGGTIVEIEMRTPQATGATWEPSDCMSAVERLLTDGVERSANAVERDLRESGSSYRRTTVLSALGVLVAAGRISSRPAPRGSRLYSTPVAAAHELF